MMRLQDAIYSDDFLQIDELCACENAHKIVQTFKLCNNHSLWLGRFSKVSFYIYFWFFRMTGTCYFSRIKIEMKTREKKTVIFVIAKMLQCVRYIFAYTRAWTSEYYLHWFWTCWKYHILSGLLETKIFINIKIFRETSTKCACLITATSTSSSSSSTSSSFRLELLLSTRINMICVHFHRVFSVRFEQVLIIRSKFVLSLFLHLLAHNRRERLPFKVGALHFAQRSSLRLDNILNVYYKYRRLTEITSISTGRPFSLVIYKIPLNTTKCWRGVVGLQTIEEYRQHTHTYTQKKTSMLQAIKSHR